ncbi:MAG: hydantoinase B/oxoprolinase family protein [Chloroflexota bacterium]
MRHINDPITLEIIQNSLQATADEMFAVMRRTAMSAIIYEVLDMGTGVIDRTGEMASSGAGIPTFVGVLDKTVKRLLQKFDQPGDIQPGDIFITNDPYNGGVTHLNDVVLTMPVFYQEPEPELEPKPELVEGFGNGSGVLRQTQLLGRSPEIIAWTANIAHWNDIGGMVPGGMSTEATEIFQEGLILPGVKIVSRGEPIRAVFDILTANSRRPDFLTGDLWAAIAAVRVGERRILETAHKYGNETFLHALDVHLNYGEEVSLHALRTLPNGSYSLDEQQDNGEIYTVSIQISDDEFIVDLRGNPDQDLGPFNMSGDRATIACQVAFKNILDSGKAHLGKVANGGSFRPLKVKLREGSVFHPHFPAAMAINYEISIRLHDLILRCLAPYLGERIPAGNFASICGTVFGGIHPDTGRPYTVVEPQIGGWGGTSQRDGNAGQFSASHGETYNCPAEVAEARYGVTVDHLSVHNEDGGAGLHRGGNGVRIDYRIRSDNAWLTAAYTRDTVPPWGLEGGKNGSGNHIVIRRSNGETERYAVIGGMTLNTDDVIQVMTATGAGWGDPLERDEALVKDDLKNGYITEEQANRDYGLSKRF